MTILIMLLAGVSPVLAEESQDNVDVAQVVRAHFRVHEGHDHRRCLELLANGRGFEVMAECEKLFTTGDFEDSCDVRLSADNLNRWLGPAGFWSLLIRMIPRIARERTLEMDLLNYLKWTERANWPQGYVPLSMYADVAMHASDPHNRELHYRSTGCLDQRLGFARYAAALAVVARAKGEAAEAQQQYEQAMDQLQEAVDRLQQELQEELKQLVEDPDKKPQKRQRLAWAYGTRGELHAAWEQWAEALADYNAVIELAPEYVWAYRLRAAAYRGMGEEEKARADEKQVEELLKTDLETRGKWLLARYTQKPE